MRKLIAILALLPGCLWGTSSGWAAGEPAPDQPAPMAEETIELPPLFVDELRKGARWLYVEFPGVEILASCPSYSVRKFVKGYQIQRELLQLVVPAEFQMKASVPELFIIYDRSNGQAMPAEWVEMSNNLGPKTPKVSMDRPWERSLVTTRMVPNLLINGLDCFASCLDVSQLEAFHGSNSWELAMRMSEDRLRLMMERCTPAMPDWYIDGAAHLMNSVQFERGMLTIRDLDWPLKDERGRAVVGKKTGRDAPRSHPMMPLIQIFESATETDATVKAWRQASRALFIRWALDVKKPEWRESLWKLVRQSSRAPVTEAMLQECFGQDVKQIEKQLDRYLGLAVRRPLSLRPVVRSKQEEVEIRDASAVEIARITGDWQRLAADYIADKPAYRVRYLEAARKALGKIDNRASSPVLTTLSGLIEVSAANEARAAELLEEAMKSGDLAVFRPAAGYHLARYRLASAQRNGGNGMLSEEQARYILAPLERVRGLQPAMPEGARLCTEIWWRCETLPADAQETLQTYVRLFPADQVLVLRIAELFRRHGANGAASSVASQGLVIAHDPQVRERFKLFVLRDEERERK